MAKILVIEDESILRVEVVRWLTLEGHQVVGASDGVEGVELAFQDPPDLVICDITMPRLDGYGVLIELRANQSTMNIPFIFVTARADYEDLRQGMEMGADDYLTKPFTLEELLNAVRARLGKKAAQEAHHRQELEEWRRALEAEREQRILRGKLVSMYSYDFRNPLSGVLSSSSLLRRYYDRMDESQREAHFDRIEASVKQLVQLLDELLIVSRMESGAFRLEPTHHDITQFVQRLIADFQLLYSGACRVRLESQRTGTYVIDHRLFRQIFTNLLTIAVRYSPLEDLIRVTLAYEDGSLVVSVRAEGRDISDAERARLVDTRRPSDQSEAQDPALSLAIVRLAVDALGGTLELDSESGAGTGVTVRIPSPAV